MKITKFSKINGRTYQDYSWPEKKGEQDILRDFSKYNLIYGWNGTGKTTLSDILRIVEKGHVSPYDDGIKEFSIEFKGIESSKTQSINQDNIKSIQDISHLKVFNRTFVEKNVFNEQNGATPIFFIGEENIENQKQLTEKEKQLEKLKGIKEQTNKDWKKKNEDLNNFLQTKASEIRRWLNYSKSWDYDKNKFQEDCRKFQNNNLKQYENTDEEKNNLKKTINSSPLNQIDYIKNESLNLGEIHFQAKSLIEKSIVSQTINRLIENNQISNWVKEGLEIHKKYSSENCEFCDQKLPSNRISDLENHFNEEFKNLDEQLKNRIKEIDSKICNLEKFIIPDEDKFYPELKNAYSEETKKLEEQISIRKEYLQKVKKALEEKIQNLFSSSNFSIALPDYKENYIKEINSIIDTHNSSAQNHQKTVNDAIEKLKHSFVAEAIPEYLKKNDELNKLNNDHKNIQDEIKQLASEIKNLKENIFDHKKLTMGLNEDLKDYLGHSDLKFETDDHITGYRIKRGNSIATALSEGEKTAIALIYFLHSLKDNNFNIEEGIIVIDDPVSSLDEGEIFCAFGYIKEYIKDAKQIFILTHNSLFFSQVKYWFNYLEKKKRENIGYYQTICSLNNNGRTSEIIKLNNLLSTYKSEYHYLFYLLYKSSNEKENIEQYYYLPNVARRFLEVFFAFKRPQEQSLYKHLEDSTLELNKKNRIERFLNFYSHTENMGSIFHSSSKLCEGPEVINNIFELIKSIDSDHYERMKKLCNDYKE